MQVIVHPECRLEVCQKADAVGSTERIIDVIERAPEGSSFAVGTEIHLVNRLAQRFAPLGKKVITLDDAGCLCALRCIASLRSTWLGRWRIWLRAEL